MRNTAAVFDIDDTLIPSRSSASTRAQLAPIRHLLAELRRNRVKVFIVTARPGRGRWWYNRDATKRELAKYNIKYDKLLMSAQEPTPDVTAASVGREKQAHRRDIAHGRWTRQVAQTLLLTVGDQPTDLAPGSDVVKRDDDFTVMVRGAHAQAWDARVSYHIHPTLFDGRTG